MHRLEILVGLRILSLESFAIALFSFSPIKHLYISREAYTIPVLRYGVRGVTGYVAWLAAPSRPPGAPRSGGGGGSKAITVFCTNTSVDVEVSTSWEA